MLVLVGYTLSAYCWAAWDYHPKRHDHCTCIPSHLGHQAIPGLWLKSSSAPGVVEGWSPSTCVTLHTFNGKTWQPWFINKCIGWDFILNSIDQYWYAFHDWLTCQFHCFKEKKAPRCSEASNFPSCLTPSIQAVLHFRDLQWRRWTKRKLGKSVHLVSSDHVGAVDSQTALECSSNFWFRMVEESETAGMQTCPCNSTCTEGNPYVCNINI